MPEFAQGVSVFCILVVELWEQGVSAHDACDRRAGSLLDEDLIASALHFHSSAAALHPLAVKLDGLCSGHLDVGVHRCFTHFLGSPDLLG